MKIAIVTDDGVNVSKHFGRAPYFLVVELNGSLIKEKKLVPKLGHGQFHGIHEDESKGPHLGSDRKHAEIIKPIADCKVVICGGMGMGAYQSMMLNGIQPIITTLDTVEEVLDAYIKGKIEDHPELLH